MSEIIDFKTHKIIKIENPKPKEKEKQKTISFLKDIIKELKAGKLDPEKCIVMLDWKDKAGIEHYQYWQNNLIIEDVLGLIELIRYKFLNDLDL